MDNSVSFHLAPFRYVNAYFSRMKRNRTSSSILQFLASIFNQQFGGTSKYEQDFDPIANNCSSVSDYNSSNQTWTQLEVTSQSVIKWYINQTNQTVYDCTLRHVQVMGFESFGHVMMTLFLYLFGGAPDLDVSLKKKRPLIKNLS